MNVPFEQEEQEEIKDNGEENIIEENLEEFHREIDFEKADDNKEVKINDISYFKNILL